MIPHQNNKYIQDVMLCHGIRLLVSINSSNGKAAILSVLTVGQRTDLEAHGLSDSEVLLDWMHGNLFIP